MQTTPTLKPCGRPCDPNGTTERAVNVFAEGGLIELTEKAAKASAHRNAEMVKEFRR